MVRIIDLPAATNSDLNTTQNFLVVTGTNLSGGYGAARVSMGEISSFYNATGALTQVEVLDLIDSDYIFGRLNNSTLNS